jgi:hypothetical protein
MGPQLENDRFFLENDCLPLQACAYGGDAFVRGFPSSAIPRPPLFTVPFENPPVANSTFATCVMQEAGGQACIKGYEIDVVQTKIDLQLGCGLTTVVGCLLRAVSCSVCKGVTAVFVQV